MLDCVRLASMALLSSLELRLEKSQLRLICAKVSATAKSGLAHASFVDNQQIQNATFKNIAYWTRLGIKTAIFKGRLDTFWPDVLLIVQVGKLPPSGWQFRLESWYPPGQNEAIRLIIGTSSYICNNWRPLIATIPPSRPPEPHSDLHHDFWVQSLNVNWFAP